MHMTVGLPRVSVEGRSTQLKHAKLGFGTFVTTEAASDDILVCKKLVNNLFLRTVRQTLNGY